MKLFMKSSTFPSVREDPELRQAAEKVLCEGGTLSGFVEKSIRQQVQRRELDQAFIERGLKSGEAARSTGEYYSAGQVLNELDDLLAAAHLRRGK
jgi:predicted transcriptional regulator